MPVKTKQINMSDNNKETTCSDRRMDRHEWILEQHEDDIKDLHESTTKMAESIASINLTLIQLKWLAYGGASVYLMQAAGFVDLVKAVVFGV
jgi:hypothetical protein